MFDRNLLYYLSKIVLPKINLLKKKLRDSSINRGKAVGQPAYYQNAGYD